MFVLIFLIFSYAVNSMRTFSRLAQDFQIFFLARQNYWNHAIHTIQHFAICSLMSCSVRWLPVVKLHYNVFQTFFSYYFSKNPEWSRNEYNENEFCSVKLQIDSASFYFHNSWQLWILNIWIFEHKVYESRAMKLRADATGKLASLMGSERFKSLHVKHFYDGKSASAKKLLNDCFLIISKKNFLGVFFAHIVWNKFSWICCIFAEFVTIYEIFFV